MIYIGSDHAGYPLKEKVKKRLKEWGYEFEDLTPVLEQKDDYPDAAVLVANKVVAENTKGIVICRSGVGMCMAANKVKGIRAGVVFDKGQSQMAREHNDLNVLCLSADWLDDNKSFLIVEAFLKTEFSGEERHVRRIKKISNYETNKR